MYLGGACAGTQTGLSNPQLLATAAADADGSFAIDADVVRHEISVAD